jgi:hypothetical protein
MKYVPQNAELCMTCNATCTIFSILLTESAFLIGQTRKDMSWIASVNIYTFQKGPRDLDKEVYRYDQICSSKCEVMHTCNTTGRLSDF